MAAALAAAEAGAQVVLIEKCAQLGGTTSISVGSFTAACTAFQRAKGIEDNPAWHDEDMGKFASHWEIHNNAGLRALFARHAPETLNWLTSLGVEFYGPSAEPPNRVARMHNVVPNARAYISVLWRAAMRRGVVVLTRHRAEKLVREDGGRVVGVRVHRFDGRTLMLRARRGVVLAAGDYSSGDSIKRQHLPPDIAAVEGINSNATGDGHRLAAEAGAELVNMDLVYGPEIRFVSPPRLPFNQSLPANPLLARLLGSVMGLVPRPILRRIQQRLLVTWQRPETAILRDGAILVNRHGQRFADETAHPELAVPGQPQGIAYIVFDRALAGKYSRWPHFISTAPDIAYAYIQDYRRLRPDVYAEAATLASLARQRGMQQHSLEDSVQSYNQAARGLAADAFGRKFFGPALQDSPYYALGPVRSWLVTTEGGVRIDEQMQVLDHKGRVLPGLYAGGCNGTGGVVIAGHGLHIAWAFTSGRLAGRNAALNFQKAEHTPTDSGDTRKIGLHHE